jgi:cobalt-precorrin-5B (C1)-methyltransferase
MAAVCGSNTTAEAFGHAGGLGLGDAVARQARDVAMAVLEDPEIAVEVLVFDSTKALLGRAEFAPSHARNRLT